MAKSFLADLIKQRRQLRQTVMRHKAQFKLQFFDLPVKCESCGKFYAKIMELKYTTLEQVSNILKVWLCEGCYLTLSDDWNPKRE